MSDLLRFEIWQVFLLEKPLSCVLMKAKMLKFVAKEFLEAKWFGGVNYVIVHFRFALYQGYKFYIFFLQIFSSSFFTSTSNGVSYLALINWFGGLKMRCS